MSAPPVAGTPNPASDLAASLSTAETAQLNACETVIARGIHAFNEVGSALMRVRDGKLYRARYSTFDEYCEARWRISRSRAYQLVDATETLSTIVDKIDVPAPTNEAQLRALTAVPELERADVWTQAHARTDGKPTAAAVREVHKERSAPPAAERVASPSAAERPDPGPAVANAINYTQAHGAKPEEPHAEWRAKFAAAIRGASRLAGEFADGDIVSNADDALLAEWGRVIDTLTEKRGRVLAARTTPDNVRHLKAV